MSALSFAFEVLRSRIGAGNSGMKYLRTHCSHRLSVGPGTQRQGIHGPYQANRRNLSRIGSIANQVRTMAPECGQGAHGYALMARPLWQRFCLSRTKRYTSNPGRSVNNRIPPFALPFSEYLTGMSCHPS